MENKQKEKNDNKLVMKIIFFCALWVSFAAFLYMYIKK